MPLVTLINQKTFDCPEGASILDSALANNVTLEYSCKTGRCGVCLAQVQDGVTEPIQHEEALTPQQSKQGFVLTCCRQIKTDVALSVEDLPQLQGIQIKTHPARVDALKWLNDEVLEVTFRLPPAAQFKYLPGQYISVIGPGSVRRSYSIANAPRTDGKISLEIKKVEGGVLSAYWFEQAKINDLLRFEGPLGTFFYRNAGPKKVILLATGTGIAPIKALLQHMASLEVQVPPKIYVYWGNRFESDIYLDLQQDLPANTKLNLVLSRPESSWQGSRGYVQDIALGQHNDFENTEVYACGSNDMIQAARATFEKAGLSPHKFFSDAFVSSST